jgi:hypothetical protein
MATYKNDGYNPEEIAALNEECRETGRSFVYVEDDDDDVYDSGECVHIQFVGSENGQAVIYDGLVYTLRLHHSSMVYEMAVNQIRKTYPDYLPPEDRAPGYSISAAREEEIEEELTEVIDELEETEAVKVQEHVELDHDFDYGIGIDVALNAEIITDLVLEDFIQKFNKNTFKPDTTLYSFRSEEEE